MWELIASLAGNMLQDDLKKDGLGQGQNTINPSGVSPTAPKSEEATVEMAEQGIAPKVEAPMTSTVGNTANNMASGLLSPYTKGLDSIKSLYANPDDKQALGGVLSLLSGSRSTGQSMQIPATSDMPSMTTGNLGLPQMGGPIGFASGNNPELKRGTLANQAFGRYY